MQGNSYGGDDKVLTCVDCGAQFTFTAKDQAFYQERGYQAPRRCKTCRDKRKTGGGVPTMGGGAYGGSQGSYGGSQGSYGGGGGGGGGGYDRGNRADDRGNRAGGGGDDRGNRIDDRGNRAPQGGNYAGGGGQGQGQGQGGAPTGPQFKVQCSGCGVETTVPFKPDPNRPVYCRTCYLSRRKA